MAYPKCSSVSLWNFNRTTYNKDKCKTQQEVSKQMCVKPMNVLVCVIILIDDNIMASPGAERVFGGEGGERGEGIQSNLLHNSLHTVLRVEPAYSGGPPPETPQPSPLDTDPSDPLLHA